jgi:hypothetical protein
VRVDGLLAGFSRQGTAITAVNVGETSWLVPAASWMQPFTFGLMRRRTGIDANASEETPVAPARLIHQTAVSDASPLRRQRTISDMSSSSSRILSYRLGGRFEIGCRGERE